MVNEQRVRVTLRPSGDDDSGRIMEWRNEADAVRFSVTGRPVTAAEHEGWFAAQREDPKIHLWIAEEEGSAVGQVRVEISAETGTVSITVAAGHRGRGVGPAMLRAVLAEVADERLVERLRALVHPDNIASLRAFERAGFRRRLDLVAGFVVLEWP